MRKWQSTSLRAISSSDWSMKDVMLGQTSRVKGKRTLLNTTSAVVIDLQIDSLVYELYSLSNEDIRTVQGR